MCEVSSHVLYRKKTQLWFSTCTNEHVTLMLDNQKVSFVFIVNNILFHKILNIHTQCHGRVARRTRETRGNVNNGILIIEHRIHNYIDE